MSIYVTGDCHSKYTRFAAKAFPVQKGMDRERDFVIICGDFGLVWDREESSEERYWMDWFEKKPFTTLFVDGNHENHARLSQYPVREFAGGRVHALRPHLLHLMRGEMYEINGKKVFAFGGARSHDMPDGVLDPEKDSAKINMWRYDYDRRFRVRGESWWEEEMPSREEMEHGLAVLAEAGWEADYIVTHEAPASVKAWLSGTGAIELPEGGAPGLSDGRELEDYLEKIRTKCRYRRWFFGHLHADLRAGDRETLLYHSVIRAD